MPFLPPYRLRKICRNCCPGKFTRGLPFLFLLLLAVKGFGQEENGYDEVSVLFTVPRIGNTEITALIKNEEAWLNIKELFDYLKIKNSASANLDSLSGFFIDPKVTYLLDKTQDRIKYGEKIFDLSPSDLVQTETGLYLKSAVFCKVFGLDCQFNFRGLSFTLKTNIELPALREMQLEQMRKNLSQLKGEKKADSVLKRNFSFLHVGMADWSVTATQSANQNQLRANLALGAIVAGGEAIVNVNYNTGQPFQLRRQYYRWRYVNNDLSVVKQVSVGRIGTQSLSSIFNPVHGIQITNTPTTYRRSFGSYRYTGTTEPEWVVELYVNNILIDYVKADASGFFAFDIPIVYGNSAIRLKFYGPWGEENTREENIVVPFSFLPTGQLEYTVSGALVEDEEHSRFSRAVLNYGLSRRITLGAGGEYLSSVMQGRPMPFVNASVRLFDGLILYGEYAKDVRTKATLNYRLPSNMQLDLSYTKYNREQTAVRFTYQEERKAALTIPIRTKKISAFSRLSYNQYIVSKFRYSNAEVLLSATVAGVSTNFRTNAQYNGLSQPYIFSDLALAFRMPYGIRFSPQIQYLYSQKHINMVKAEAEKRISSQCNLNLSYQANPTLHQSAFTIGFRYDFSFARTFFSASRGNKTSSTTQSANGSFIYERKAGYVDAVNQASVGRGGFLVIAFLDLNCNGRRDKKEPRVDGLLLRVSGGRVQRRSDSSLLITGLEAYTSHLIELDNSSFDNIAWQIKKPTLKATVEPNRLRLIEVPVAVVGEASGMVYLKTRRQQKGLSRILVNFYDSSNKLIAHTLTEGDGYFSFLGLEPGRYTAQIDTAQLNILKLTVSPQWLSFDIASSEEGSVADGFEFVLQPVVEQEEKVSDTAENKNQQPVTANNKKTNTSIKPLSVQDHSAKKRKSANQKNKGNKRQVVVGKSPVIKNQRPLNNKRPKSASNSNKVKHITSTRTPSSVQKKNPSVQKQSTQPLRKQPLSKTKQQLNSELQRLDQRQQKVFRKLHQLLKEQEQLIKEQRELIKEIEQLKKQLEKAKRSRLKAATPR